MSNSKKWSTICKEKVKQDIKVCQHCLENTSIDLTQKPIYEWAQHIVYKQCHSDLFECMHYVTPHYMKTRKQLNKHHDRYHDHAINQDIVTPTRNRKRKISQLKNISIENQK